MFRNRRRRAAGFALMAALFIIVTLTAIGVYLLTISTGQIAAGVQDEQSTRAYQAARAGIDWGAYEVLALGPGCPAVPQPMTLLGFTVNVTCALVSTETEAGTSVNVYQLTSTACNAVACGAANTQPTYVERQL